MRPIIACILALWLAGCNTVGLQFATTGVQNPITKTQLYTFENSMTVAFAGLNAYKRSCVGGAIPDSCKGVVAKLQTYTRRLPPVLTSLRTFVKNNDQVNAIETYNLAVAILTEFKAVASANNVAVQ